MTGGAHLRDALSGLLDGELSAPEEASARLHLDGCPECASELAAVAAARAWVRGLPTLDPPRGFYERILGAPAARRAARPVIWRRAAALAASAAAAVSLVGLVSPRQAPVSPPVNRMVEAHFTGASLSSDPLSRLAPLGVPVSFKR